MTFKQSQKYAIKLIGTKWNLAIIVALMGGNNRFNEIQRECEVCPRTLSARLDELEQSGIIKKKVSGDNPAKVEYSLTQRGESLSSVVKSISEWSQKAN